MAGSSLLALIDDIATILDDVAAMSKVAAKKTAGVLGDDLALNAQQVAGVQADRELPVVWAVAKGSMINKAILVVITRTAPDKIRRAFVDLLLLCRESADGLRVLIGCRLPGVRHRQVRNNQFRELSLPKID